MSIEKEKIENKEIIFRMLVRVGAIKKCDCEECYWTIREDNAYALVFSELKKQNIEISTKLVQQTIKQILDNGKDLDDTCPYCNSKAKK